MGLLSRKQLRELILADDSFPIEDLELLQAMAIRNLNPDYLAVYQDLLADMEMYEHAAIIRDRIKEINEAT